MWDIWYSILNCNIFFNKLCKTIGSKICNSFLINGTLIEMFKYSLHIVYYQITVINNSWLIYLSNFLGKLKIVFSSNKFDFQQTSDWNILKIHTYHSDFLIYISWIFEFFKLIFSILHNFSEICRRFCIKTFKSLSLTISKILTPAGDYIKYLVSREFKLMKDCSKKMCIKRYVECCKF